MKKIYSIALLVFTIAHFSLAQTGKIYLNFGSHNETEDPTTYTVSAQFTPFKSYLQQIADSIIKHRAAWNMQVESNFIRAVLLNDAGASSSSDILQRFDTSAYIEIDPHNHYVLPSNPYNYPDLVKLLDSIGLPNRITMGGYLWQDPLEDWTMYHNGVAGHTFTTFTWSPTIMWGGGSQGHTNDYNAFGIWKPQGPTNALTFGTHQPSSNLTSMGNGKSNVIWPGTAADSISNNIINLADQIATGAINQTGFYTQTIMFNFKSINANTISGYVSKITEIINDLQPYVDQGKIEWVNLSGKLSKWNTLHPSPADFFVITTTLVPTVTSTVTISKSSLSTFTASVGTPSVIQSYTVSGAWLTATMSVSVSSNFEISLSSSTGFANTANITLTNGTISNKAIYVRYNPLAAGTHNGDIIMQSNGNARNSQVIAISGTSTATVTVTASPTVIINRSSLTTFTTTVGTPATVQSFTVSGSNLIGNITITPPSNFEVSLSSANGFSASSLIISPSLGTVNGTEVYVRYNPTVSGTHSGGVAVISTGVSTQSVSVSGVGTNTLTTGISTLQQGDNSLKTNVFPNPVTQTTTITWQVNELNNVKIELLDAAGKKIKTILNEKQIIGAYQKELDMKAYADGIYFIQFEVGEKTETKKIIKSSN